MNTGTLPEVAEKLYRHWGYWYGGHDCRVGRVEPDDRYGRKLAEAGPADGHPTGGTSGTSR